MKVVNFTENVSGCGIFRKLKIALLHHASLTTHKQQFICREDQINSSTVLSTKFTVTTLSINEVGCRGSFPLTIRGKIYELMSAK